MVETIQPNEGWNETYYDSGDYRQRFEHALAEASWADKAPLAGKLIDGRYHGLGVACFIEGGASGPRENARMILQRRTARIACRRLVRHRPGRRDHHGADRRRRARDPDGAHRDLHGSTNLLWEGFGSYGSRATVMGGCAVIDGGEAPAREVPRLSPPQRLGVATDQLQDRGRRRACAGRPHRATGRCRRRRPRRRRHVLQLQADLHLRHGGRARRRRSRHRPRRGAGLHRGRRRRPHHQSRDAARPGGRRRRPGPGQPCSGRTSPTTPTASSWSARSPTT